MEATPARIFPTYLALSAVTTGICLYHLWQDPSWRQRAYVDRIKQSRIGTAVRPLISFISSILISFVIVGNMIFATLLLFYRCILWVFFGTISARETEKMWQKLVNYMVINLLAVSAILDPRFEVVLKWGCWLVMMISMRLLCDMARSRFKHLIAYTPHTPWWIHGKIFLLLNLLILIDLIVFGSAWIYGVFLVGEFSKDQIFLIFSECFSLFVVAIGAIIKYCIYFLDNYHFGGSWENRGSYSYYTDFFSKAIILSVSLVYYATILHNHGVSLNIFFDILIIIRLVGIFASLGSKVMAYQTYRKLTNDPNLYKPLSPDEIAEYNDNCAICRDPMNTALKLPCGHVFHKPCLRSWLVHNHNCPTCRFALNSNSAARNQPTRIQSNSNVVNVHTNHLVSASSTQNRARNDPIRTPHNINQNSTISNMSNLNIINNYRELLVSSAPAAVRPSQHLDLYSSSSSPDNSHSITSTLTTGGQFNQTTQSNSSPSPLTAVVPVYSNQFTPNSPQLSQTTISDPLHSSHASRSRTASPPATGPQAENSTNQQPQQLQQSQQGQPNLQQNVWSFSSPTWLTWLPSLSVEVVRGQGTDGIGNLDEGGLSAHRHMLDQVKALFPDIPENVALADLLRTRDVNETINNIIENRLSWAPSPYNPSTAPPISSASYSSSSPSSPQGGPITPPHSNVLPSQTQPAAYQPQRSSPIFSTSSSSSSSPLSSSSKSLLTSSATYAQRKQALIETSRIAYLEKKGRATH